MATFLYRLGCLAFRRRWYVTLLWVVVLVGVGVGAATAPSAPDSEFSTPGVESQRAFDLMEQRFPGAQSDGANARIVFVAPDGEEVTAADNRVAIATSSRIPRGTGRFPVSGVGVEGDDPLTELDPAFSQVR